MEIADSGCAADIAEEALEFLEDWAKRKGINFTDHKDLINNEQVIARYQKEMDIHNEKFGKWERVKRFELTPDVWTIEAGHLTPTMKMKRRNIKEQYQYLYDRIYNEKI